MKRNTTEWLNFSQADLRGARLLADTISLENLAAFHCHESVEKALKAVLVDRGISFTVTQTLTELADLIEQSGTDIEAVRSNLSTMSLYATASCYPGFETNQADIPTLLSIAQVTLQFCMIAVGGQQT